jgi:hypothetical protein
MDSKLYICRPPVEKMAYAARNRVAEMRFKPHKLPHFQKGLRAMALIQSAL